MKVVLVADVKDVGQKGDEKEVKPGFARNFLLPRKLAVPAESAAAQAIIAAREKDKQEKTDKSESLKKALGDNRKLTINFKRKAKGKKLFGSVKPDEIMKEIEKMIGIAPKKIEPDKPVKEIGELTLLAIFSGGKKQEVRVKIEAVEDKKSNK